MEKSQVVLKKRAKRMKAMEKRLDGVEYCERYLKRRPKRKTMEEKLDGIEKEMKRNENREDFMYQNMGYERSYDRNEEEQMQKSQLNHDNEIEEEVETENSHEKLEKEAAKEPKETPTPPWPKAIAVRNRPRKSTDPKKFTTPERTTRTVHGPRWVSSPFTEADTGEIEEQEEA
ncbi:hypothetical protein Bca52824_025619 [Brassica carinata]|uniref:Uncharacterized protein n=1 Tax=Brassica carinata TaxID=52824 RepID=A0A8X7V9Z6_BRACI|nr:hypothetical protein Bca52824_025619 [Brassica carinata]